jgi:hypothetical protein
MMHGAAAAKQFVNSYLEEDLPSRLVTYRNHWQVDEDALGEPLKYLTYEPVALDHWPTLITLAMSTSNISRFDYTSEMDPVYRVRYTMRTYVWVKAESATECTENRDNLTTVVRSALLDHAGLRTVDRESCDAVVDESTMREEFSDLTLIKGERVMAGAYVAYDLNINEVVVRKPIAEALTSLQIEPEVLPFRFLQQE